MEKSFGKGKWLRSDRGGRGGGGSFNQHIQENIGRRKATRGGLVHRVSFYLSGRQFLGEIGWGLNTGKGGKCILSRNP